MNVVDRMAQLAMIAHNGMSRNGQGNIPYIVHPHAVVSMLKEWGYSEDDDPVTLSVAWGHDILEDTDTPESKIREIDDKLGERILCGIKMLTFSPDIHAEQADHQRQKANYISNVARVALPEIVIVKIADRLCNAIDFMTSGHMKYADTYMRRGEPLVERIADCKHAARAFDTWLSVMTAVSGHSNDRSEDKER